MKSSHLKKRKLKPFTLLPPMVHIAIYYTYPIAMLLYKSKIVVLSLSRMFKSSASSSVSLFKVSLTSVLRPLMPIAPDRTNGAKPKSKSVVM